LHDAGYYPKYLQAKQWFDEWGFWAVFLAGFSPIPYKVFTITAGVISMAFLPFLVASAIGRGARFYLVAGLLNWGGEGMEKTLRKYIDIIGWATVALVIILLIVIKW
jgi:membrane protein YqaA with SNARE-associated domain